MAQQIHILVTVVRYQLVENGEWYTGIGIEGTERKVTIGTDGKVVKHPWVARDNPERGCFTLHEDE